MSVSFSLEMSTTPLAEATAGALGAVFSNTLVFPLDVYLFTILFLPFSRIKTRLQVQTKAVGSTTQYHSILDAFLSILKSEGITGLYKGLGSGTVGTIASSFSYFYIYSHIRQSVLQKAMKSLDTRTELLIGALAGALCQLIVLPIAIVTTREQTSTTSAGIPETIRSIIDTDGIQGLWKGLNASLILCSNPAITYGVFERLKTFWLSKSGSTSLTSIQVFIIGAISKTLATIVTYPYIMAKVRLQWKPPVNTKECSEKELDLVHYTSALDVLKKVYMSEGIRGIYKGLSAQILKAVLSQAILFVAKEKLTAYTIIMVSAFSKKLKVVE